MFVTFVTCSGGRSPWKKWKEHLRQGSPPRLASDGPNVELVRGQTASPLWPTARDS